MELVRIEILCPILRLVELGGDVSEFAEPKKGLVRECLPKMEAILGECNSDRLRKRMEKKISAAREFLES